MNSPPVVLGRGDAEAKLAERGVLIVDGNKMSDKTTTIYRLKSKDNKQLMMQFGTGLDKLAPCSIVSFADKDDAARKRRICFVSMEDESGALAKEELDACIRMIGKQLYDGRQIYWGGRVKDDMDFDEFMSRRSAIVKTNSVTNALEAVVKCPEKLSRFYHISNIGKDEQGNWKFNRRPISRFNTSSRPFTGLVSCTVGVYTGWNKGCTWGVYLNVRDALLSPVDMSARKAAASNISMDFGGAKVDMTVEETKMVMDAERGDHEEGASDLEDEGSESGGKRGMAAGFVEPPVLKRTKRM